MGEIPIAFDWWRCGGRVIKAPSIPPPPSLHQQEMQLPFKQPLHNMVNPTFVAVPIAHHQYQSDPFGDNAWPIHKVFDQADDSVAKDPNDQNDMGCEVSRDYWHRPYKFKKCDRNCRDGPRPAWCPAKIPTDCTGVVNYPPPYSNYCRNRDKLSCSK